MKRARDITLSIAIGASLVAHAFLVYAVSEDFSRSRGWRIWLPPAPKVDQPVTWLVKEPAQQFPTMRRPDNEMGESTGTGDASNAVEGVEPQQAMAAPDVQAFLSRDPSGAGQVGAEPTPSVAPESPGSPGHTSAMPFGVPPSPAADQVPVANKQPPTPPKPPAEAPAPDVPPPADPAVAADKPLADDATAIGLGVTLEPKPEEPKPADAAPVDKPSDDKSAEEAKAEASLPAPPPSDLNKPADPQRDQPAVAATPPAADPAPLSDSESDPFSKIGSVEFRPGKVDVRFGRKIKTTRPHLTLAGQYDLATQASPRVILKIKTDETGKVIDVAIFQSSGSNEIDSPCVRAVYDWWFEPPKDKAGKPIPDVILFAIDFRRA